jgi:hypothetical protein
VRKQWKSNGQRFQALAVFTLTPVAIVRSLTRSLPNHRLKAVPLGRHFSLTNKVVESSKRRG